MKLIATYDFHYGQRGPLDREAELLRRGDAFLPLPTALASAEEVAADMIHRGAAVTPEKWEKRKPEADRNWAWAQAEVQRMNAGGRA